MTDENLKKQLQLVTDNTIYETVHGSHAYGTNIATSDVDVKGICIMPDRRFFYGMKTFEQQDGGWDQDKVIYHLPKFMQLAGQCNPNIIEVLFCDESDILKITDEGRKLRDRRSVFLSRRARHTFSGYAHAQLKRIKAHKRWIDNPPEKPESAASKHLKEFVVGPLGTQLPQGCKIVSIREIGHAELKDKFNTIVPASECFLDHAWHVVTTEVFDKGSYESAKREYENYISWKENRNEKRSELERKYGIDTKHAMHLVRLLRMGYEIVSEGKVIVKRPDKEELLSIRNGAWSYEKILDYAAEMDLKTEEAEKTSPLPWAPDWESIEELQMELIEDQLHKQKRLDLANSLD